MSDLESLGLEMHFGPVPGGSRSARIRRSVAARETAEGCATQLPFPQDRTRNVLTLSVQAVGLAGPYMVALMGGFGKIEAFATTGSESRTLGAFAETPEGYRDARACASGAIAALCMVYGDPVPVMPASAA